jgi:hypothetical protein
MAKYIMKAEPGFVNFSAFAFHQHALHYYKCVQDFRSPDSWSPVPYALLCRAIELELKARHLEITPGQSGVRKYRHNLERAYEALPPSQKILTVAERAILRKANKVYNDDKGFDYIQPVDAAHGYRRFVDLGSLDALTKKLLGI